MQPLKYFVLVLLGCVYTGCQQPEPEPEPVYELSISSVGEMFDGDAASWTVTVSGNADFEVIVPEDVDLGHRSVETEVFMGCTSLKGIDALINGEMAFKGCTSLEEIRLQHKLSILCPAYLLRSVRMLSSARVPT